MKKSLFLLFLIIRVVSNAQMLNNDFNPQDIGFNDEENYNEKALRKSVIQSDGKILLAGSFSTYQNTYEHKVVRLNADGTKDLSFSISSADSYIGNLVLQDDGKIIVIGGFKKYNGEDRAGIVRLNVDGTLDNSFNTTFTLDSGVSCAVANNGKIVIGGSLTNVKGTSRIIKLNNDGSIDDTFNSTVFDQNVSVIANYPGDKYIVWSYSTNSFVRLNNDGSLDNTFTNYKFNGFLNDIKVTADNKIYVSGSFTTYNLIKRINLARLNGDGTLDTSFNPQNGTDGNIISMAALNDNSLLIVGDFTKYNGVERKSIAKVNADGSLNSNFNPTQLPNNNVSGIKIINNNSFLIYGYFDLVGTNPRKNIAKYNYEFLDTNDFTKKTLLIYPNPASNKINFSEPLSNIKIYDLSGKKVLESQKEATNLELGNFLKGIYILSGIDAKGNNKSTKIEKK